MATFRQKFNKKYGYDKDESHSIADIAKITGIKKSIIQEAYNRGSGAWETSKESIRNKYTGEKREGGFPASQRMSKEAWSFGRSYGLVMNNKKQTAKGAPDRDLWEKIMKSDFSIIYNGILKNVKNARS